MTFRTHREFAVIFVIIANFIVYKLHLSNTGYYINLAVMLLFGKQGALFPDVDHNWENVKEKTVINRVINFVIHATGGTHRSWQTHSWDIWVLSLILALHIYSKMSISDKTVFIVIILGFWSGWFSHLFSDMLTSGGVRILCISKKTTVHLVPKHANLAINTTIGVLIAGAGAVALTVLHNNLLGVGLIVLGAVAIGLAFKIGDMKFNTGGAWENTVYRCIVRLNMVATVFAIVYPVLEKFYNI